MIAIIVAIVIITGDSTAAAMTISVSVLTQFKWRCACPAKSS
jgi:hypothetical protein